MNYHRWLRCLAEKLLRRLRYDAGEPELPRVTYIQRYVIFHRPHTDSRVKIAFGSSLDVMDDDDLDLIASDELGSPGWVSGGREMHRVTERRP